MTDNQQTTKKPARQTADIAARARPTPVTRLAIYCPDCNRTTTVDGCDRPGCEWRKENAA